MKRKLYLILFLISLSGIVVVSLSALVPVIKSYPPPGTSILKPFVFEWDYPDQTGIQPDGYLFGLWFEPDGNQGVPPMPFDEDGNPLPDYWFEVGTNTSLSHDNPLISGFIDQFWPWWPWCTPCHWWWWEIWPYAYGDDGMIQYLDVALFNPWIFHDSYPAIDKIYPPHGIDIIKPFVFQWQPYPDLVFDPPAGYDFGGYLLGIWWDPWYCQGEPPWPFPIPWDPSLPLPEPYPQPPYPDPPSDWPGMLWIDVGDVTSISSNNDLITSYMSYWIGDPFWWPWCIPCYYWWWEVWPYYYHVDTGGVIDYWYPDPYYYCFWPWKFHADGPPLPVELSSFTASMVSNNFVQLTWVSETESNMLGYNVFRNTEDFIDEAVRINPLIIPANNTSQQQVYSYIDQEVIANVTYYYWLEMNDLDLTSQFFGPISILVNMEEEGEGPPAIPFVTELVGAFPNPFNPDTNIAFTLAEEAKVTITVYNVKGQKVQTLTDNRNYDKGYHTVIWDGKDSNGHQAASGVYYYRMETDSFYVMVKKMMLMK